jgi:hypothetical protein
MNEDSTQPTGSLIKAYVLPGAERNADKLIRPARAKRDWMDRTPENYAYRCTPMSAANTMGWEIINPVDCEFRWNGLTPHQQVFIYSQRETRYGPKSHFGTGIITWELPFLFRTSADYGIAVTGPANHDHAHITPLDGFIRTDWLPFPFTMNWRITTPDVVIRFEEGEPIARVFPYPLALLDEAEIELHDLSEDPEFQKRFDQWKGRRQHSYQQRQQEMERTQPGKNPERDPHWSRQYATGTGADAAEREHQTVFRCKPVRDTRSRKA